MSKNRWSRALVLSASLVVAGCGSSGGGDAGSGGSAGGAGGTSGTGGSDLPLTISDVEPASTTGSDWNEYVSSADVDQPCTPSASYAECIHAGELRVVTVTGADDCTAIVGTDDLGAFAWECTDEAGTVTLRSAGLLPGNKLSDLIDIASASWRSNSVTVTDGDRSATTGSSVWWSNPIAINNDGGSLANPGTIYLATEDVSASYSIDANQVGLVIQEGASVQGNDVGGSVITAFSRSGIWLEGAIDAASDGLGVELNDVAFSRLHGVTVEGADNPPENGIQMTDCRANTFVNVASARNGNYGIYATASPRNGFSGVTVDGNDSWGFVVEDSDENVITDFVAANNQNWGLNVHTSPGTRLIGATTTNNTNWGIRFVNSHNSVLYDIRSYNNENWGVNVFESDNVIVVSLLTAHQRNYGLNFDTLGSVVLNATSVNNDNRGFNINAANTLFINLAAVNNDDTGVHLGDFGLSGDANNTFVNVASAHNTGAGLGLFSEGNVFTGSLRVGDNADDDCDVDAGLSNPGLTDGDCDNTVISDATRTAGVNLGQSYVAKVDSDSANPDDVNGTAPYDSITDWVSLENGLRTWGLDDGTFPSDMHDTDCRAGNTCRIWDWSLSSADSVLRAVNPLPTGDDTYVHTWVAAAQEDCDAIDGASWSDSTCTSNILLNATERMGDAIGNDNGLCESDEDCVYSPNIGRYQGHGALVDTGTIVSGGGIENVRLYEYETNGR